VEPFGHHFAQGPAPDPSRTRQVELVLAQLTTLPTLSPIASRVLALASSNDPDFDAIIELIESDPALSARTLALCKKAAFGISHPITSVRRAAALLGIESVQSSLLSLQIYEVLGGDTHLGEDRGGSSAFDRAGFWRHALGVACAAQLIARTNKSLGVSPEEAFTAGLVHDLGKLALDWVLPRTYARVIELSRARCTDIAQVERSLIGLDHHVAGKRLGEHWGLPHVLLDAMWLHAQSPSSMPDVPHRATLVVVAAGDALARRLHIGWSGNDEPTPGPQELGRWVGLEASAIDGLCEQVMVEVARRAQALGLSEAGEREQVISSLARANERLATLHERASERGQQARRQARVLESVSSFTRASAGEHSVAGVLACVGKSVIDLAGAGFVAALHQSRPGEPWRMARLDKPGESRHELEPPRDARGQPMDLRSIGTGESLGWAIARTCARCGLCPWSRARGRRHCWCTSRTWSNPAARARRMRRWWARGPAPSPGRCSTRARASSRKRSRKRRAHSRTRNRN
jgi:HD-like signal output (HDOD) protein